MGRLLVVKGGFVYVAGTSATTRKSTDANVIIKYDAVTKQQIWVRRNSVRARALVVDDIGNVYIAGSIQNSAGNLDYAVLKYNESATQQWLAPYAGHGNLHDIAWGMQVDAAGNVFVTGHCNATTAENLSGRSIATVKFNSALVKEWDAVYDALPNTESGNAEDGHSLALDGNVWWVCSLQGK